MQKNKTYDECKLQGNQAVHLGNYDEALKSYDNALKVSTGPEQAKTIRLNRSHVELCSKYFDAALEDAKNVLLDDPRNEKALFRAARALYELRRFSDSQSYLQKLIALYPKNGRAVEDMRKLHQRMREETGDYDYAGMLKEATSCSTLDRGSYIGPVEIKQSQNRGRGLFLTKDVKAGDLLLAEKAFSVISLGQADQPDMAETIHKARRSLAKDCISQLRRNPSLVSAFSNLYTGSRPHEDPNPSRERENLDRSHVDFAITFNALEFCNSSLDSHRDLIHDPTKLLTRPSWIGLWMHASSINHSCLPNISRSYTGDMMILRAAKDLSKGQELLFYYTDPTQPYTTRKKFLSGYGFECNCQLCSIEKCETNAKMTAWEALECEFSKEFSNAGPVAFEKFQTITTKMIEITQHWHDCPRLKIIEPLSVLIEMAFRSKVSSVVLDTSRHLLTLLGFRLEITNKKFQVQEWGFVTDTVLICIAEMLAEFLLQHRPSSFCAQVESFSKTAYEIVVGETASYEDTYGKGQLLSRRKGSGKLDEAKINQVMKELTGDE